MFPLDSGVGLRAGLSDAFQEQAQMSTSNTKSRITAATGAALLTLALAVPADAFWSRRNLEPFNPNVNPPRNYDPTAIGHGGTGGNAGPSDCYWSREQIPVSGRLVWRPLLMCHYPSS